MSISEITEFCSTIRDRTKEHKEAFDTLMNNGNYGVAIGLLRQELDSLIHATYISCLGPKTVEAKRLVNDFLIGNKWYHITAKGKKQLITDKEMVELEGGWVTMVYHFGCKLIHLSDYHSYSRNDPFQKMTADQIAEVIGYLEYYHGYPFSDISMNKFVPYLPKIIQKIIDNCAYYVNDIEEQA